MEVRLLVDRERAAEQVDRLLVAPGHVGERAAQGKRMQVAGLGGEHLRVKPLRLGKLAGLMVAHGGVEGFGGSHRRHRERGPYRSTVSPPAGSWMSGKNRSCHFAGGSFTVPTLPMNTAVLNTFSGDSVKA